MLSLKQLSWVRFAKDDGISIVKLIPLKTNTVSLLNFESQDKEEGFEILKKLLERSSTVSCVRLPNEDGIDPDNWQ